MKSSRLILPEQVTCLTKKGIECVHTRSTSRIHSLAVQIAILNQNMRRVLNTALAVIKRLWYKKLTLSYIQTTGYAIKSFGVFKEDQSVKMPEKDDQAFEAAFASINKISRDNVMGMLETLAFAITENSKRYRFLLERKDALARSRAGLPPVETMELESMQQEVCQLKKDIEKYRQMAEVASTIAMNLVDLCSLSGDNTVRESISSQIDVIQKTVAEQLRMNKLLEQHCCP